MTTPTREQECKHEHIKTWVFADTKEPAMWSCAYCGLKFAPEMATLTAGRAQGLREAKEAVQALHAKVADPIFGQERHDVGHAVLDNCAAAIEQLRAQPIS